MADTPFAERLNELLAQPPKTTRAELAKVLGVTRQSISTYISGSTKPSPKVLVTLADYFGVTTDYLLGVDNTRSFKKGTMPRICNILGYPVGEPFRIKENSEVLHITQLGEVVNSRNELCSASILATLINYPSLISPCPELRMPSDMLGENELMLLLPLIRDMDVRWVTMDDTRALDANDGPGAPPHIVFWKTQPSINKGMKEEGCIVYEGEGRIGSLLAEQFPSFSPGSCFYVYDFILSHTMQDSED